MSLLYAALAALAIMGATFVLVVASGRVLLARHQMRQRTQRLLADDGTAAQAAWRALARAVLARPASQHAAAACVLVALVALVAGAALRAWMQGLVLAVVALGLAYLLLRQGRARRRDRLDAQLVPALRMMAAGTESGFSVQQAIERAASDSPMPIAEEFALVVRRIALGASLEDALTELARRCGENFELLAHIVIVQYRAGGNLPGLLLGLAGNVQERLQFRDEARALTAQARYSGLILALLPFGFLALITLVSPAYVQGLFNSSSGRVMLLAGGGLLTIGVVSIRAISRVEI
jgi:tight adherence protein B